MRMNRQLLLTLLALLWLIPSVSGQSLSELQQMLDEATTPEDEMFANLRLGEALLERDAESSVIHSKDAYKIASQANNLEISAESSLLTAKGYGRLGDLAQEQNWYELALSFARRSQQENISKEALDRLQILEKELANQPKPAPATALNEAGRESKPTKGETQRAEYLKQQISQLERRRNRLRYEVRKLEQQRKEINGNLASDLSSLPDLDDSELALEPLPAFDDMIMFDQAVLDSLVRKNSESPEQAAAASEMVAARVAKFQLQSREEIASQAILQETRANMAQGIFQKERQQILLLASGIVLVFLALLALLSFSRFRSNLKAKKQLHIKDQVIEEEMLRSTELMEQIMPAAFARELDENGVAPVRTFEDASILYSEFANFQQVAQQLNPEELVEELDTCFKAIDIILDQYEGVEKIKTMGGSFLCASGLSDQKTLPNTIIQASLEIGEFMEEYKQEKLRSGKPFFEIRMGIHTGPVVAGVVGGPKYAFDLWGTSVDTAKRVESQARFGKVNISEATYRLVKYQFDCSFRGTVNGLPNGAVETYSVEKERTPVLQNA